MSMERRRPTSRTDMKGAIFKHFEAFVSDNWGVEVYEEILDGLDLLTEGPFLGPGSYPDEDLLSIVGATIQKLGIPLPDALRVFGKYLFPKLAGDAPQFVEGQSDLKQFLMTVDGVIHVEVKKLFPDAYLPRLLYEDTADDQLTVHYQSKRQFCQLFVGLVEGAAERFSTPIAWDETACSHTGSEQCTFEFRFSAAA